MSNQYKNYIPAVPIPADDFLSPPPAPLPDPPSAREGMRAETAWFIVTLAILLMTLILFTAMVIDGSSTRQAITAGTRFFLITMGLVVFVLSGTLTDILRAWWRERTERQRIDAYSNLGEQAIRWRQSVEDNRRLEILRESLPGDMSKRLAAVERALLEARNGRGDAEGVQPDTYVAPYDNRARGPFAHANLADTTAEEALRWAKTLYRADNGEPDGDMVWLTGKEPSHGKLRGKMLGSARDKEGSDAARLWLLDREIIVAKRVGYCLNLARYPRRDTLYYVD